MRRHPEKPVKALLRIMQPHKVTRHHARMIAPVIADRIDHILQLRKPSRRIHVKALIVGQIHAVF